MRTEFRKLKIITGLKTFNSKFPCEPANADGGVIAHHLHGDHRQRFGLRGIYLAGHDARSPARFPECVSSPRPQRGPEASQRTSLAIFISEAARVFSAPLA